jgi:hypothetical protein
MTDLAGKKTKRLAKAMDTCYNKSVTIFFSAPPLSAAMKKGIRCES